MTFDLESVRAAYLAERPVYARLAQHVAGMLQKETRRQGIPCTVDDRAKEIQSFLKKALRKKYTSPLEETRDKAGVRVIISYANTLNALSDIIYKLFIVDNCEDKRNNLGYDQLGYQGVHYEIRLHPEAVPDYDQGLTDKICEIQLHTAAQHLWSDISHRFLYKPPQPPEPETQRAIYRLVAIVEIFDKEVVAARQEILTQPNFPEAMMLDSLESQYYRLVGRPFDRELSLHVVQALRPLFTASELDRYDSMLHDFVDQHEGKLGEIYEDYAEDKRVDLLLYQPESLLVFELLEKDPFRLRQAWSRVLPVDLLESLASIWGRPM